MFLDYFDTYVCDANSTASNKPVGRRCDSLGGTGPPARRADSAESLDDMWDWLAAAQAIHIALIVLTAVGLVGFWVRTRFWLPRYVHYLAGLGLAVGLACLAFMPPTAPINRGSWGGIKKALLVLIMPALVYIVFILYGGQKAAYEAAHRNDLVLCPYCRNAEVLPGSQCRSCGQTVAS